MTPGDAVVAAAAAAFPAGWVYQPDPATRPSGAVVVYDTLILARPTDTRWVAVYPSGPDVVQAGICHAGEMVMLRWQVSTFAPTRQQAEWLAGKVRDFYMTSWVAADGWAPAVVEQEVSVQARPDEAVRAVPLVSCVDRYSALFTKL